MINAMKYFVSLIVVLSSWSAFANVGFAEGSRYKIAPLDGHLSVSCLENQSRYQFTCRSSSLGPVNRSYFQGPVMTNADTIEIVATGEDGTQVRKVDDYDPILGRSFSRINLGVDLFLDRPLLQLGRNRIDYKLYKRNQLVSHGSLFVDVVRDTRRTCSSQTVVISQARDCQSQFTLCQKFFERNTSCQ